MRPSLVLLAPLLACTAASPAARLQPLCGTWETGDLDGQRIRERWWLAADGLQGESHTHDRSDAVVFSEKIALRIDGDVSVYHAEPGGAAPTDFREVRDPALTAGAGEHLWIWQNLAHDFPRRIVYRVAGDTLTATVSDPDGEEEARRGITWTFTRVAACGA